MTGAGDKGVFRPAAIEKALAGNWAAAAIEASRSTPTASSPTFRPADYRANLIKVMANARSQRRSQDAAAPLPGGGGRFFLEPD